MRKRKFMPRNISAIGRFDILTNKHSGIYGESGLFPTECWIWTGEITNNGYGRMTYMHQRYTAHRFSYESYIQSIPEGMQIDHLCRNRKCVNPTHLEPVTPSENLARGNTVNAVNKKKTHCIHNHKFTPTNTGVDSRGDRYCKECSRQKAARFRNKKRMENQVC